MRAPPSLTAGPGVWVEKAYITRVTVNVRDPYMLGAPTVNHHVPGIAVQTVGPVIVTLSTTL